MTPAILESALLRAVKPIDLAAYAAASGWREVGVVPNRATLWTRDAEELLVPLSERFGDYARRIAEAIAVLSLVEDRAQAQVWRDVVAAGFDRIRLRAVDPDYAGGTVPLRDGVALVERARDIVLAAACAAVEPRPVYHTRKPRAAVEYLDSVRLGQTEVGSFVIALDSPVAPLLQQSLLQGRGVDDDPFERSVTRMLMSSLDAMNTAAHRAAATRSFAPFDEAQPAGVSANLCEAIVEFYGVARAQSLEISVSWAAVRPMGDPAVPSRVTLSRDVVQPLRGASLGFRKQRPELGVEVAGFVVKLEREEGELLGRATVFGAVGDRPATRRVKVELPDALYGKALRAHASGVPVRMIGELRRDGRTYGLYGVRDVILDEEAVEA